MSEALKPCPFCGSRVKAHIGLNAFDDVEVRCKKCGSSGGCFDLETEIQGGQRKVNMAAAVAHWNTRVQ